MLPLGRGTLTLSGLYRPTPRQRPPVPTTHFPSASSRALPPAPPPREAEAAAAAAGERRWAARRAGPGRAAAAEAQARRAVIGGRRAASRLPWRRGPPRGPPGAREARARRGGDG